jgi:hypothetical protein
MELHIITCNVATKRVMFMVMTGTVAAKRVMLLVMTSKVAAQRDSRWPQIDSRWF